jgi:NAD(P)-dependent dehydrogenase (short-subunit alcohol dehydrogenase family)
VLAIGRNAESLKKIQSAFPNNVFLAQLDVCNSAALEEAVKTFVEKQGKFNGAVHAAGISELTPIKSNDVDIAKKIMDISFWAGMDLLHLVTKAKYGINGTSTVLFSSVSAFSHEKGMYAYSAAKAAMNCGLQSVAKEICVKKHRVNSIVPGWVKTPMTEKEEVTEEKYSVFDRHLLGVGTPQDVVGMVLFLLSDRATWITGSTVVVDGGYLA